MTEIGFADLEAMAFAGESETVEFKKSTAQLPRAGETLCGMLNGIGGLVVIGVAPNGQIVGQEIADSTQQELARMLDRFEPPTPIEHRILPIPNSRLRNNSVVVTFRATIGPTPQVTPQVHAILVAASEPRSRTELQRSAGLRDRKNFRVKHLDPLIAAGWLEMTNPEKPNSSQQRYRITDAGRAILSKEDAR